MPEAIVGENGHTKPATGKYNAEKYGSFTVLVGINRA